MSEQISQESFATLESLTALIHDELKPILVTYIQHSPTTLVKLKQAVKSGDINQVASLAHLLKGSSANLGFTQFSAQCADLEHAAQAKKPLADLQTQINSLITDAEFLHQRLEQFIMDRF